MATKTLTITEDAYNLLVGNKVEEESFSKEIVRLLSGKEKKDLTAYFGLLSESEAKGIDQFLEKRRKANCKRAEERRKLWS